MASIQSAGRSVPEGAEALVSRRSYPVGAKRALSRQRESGVTGCGAIRRGSVLWGAARSLIQSAIAREVPRSKGPEAIDYMHRSDLGHLGSPCPSAATRAEARGACATPQSTHSCGILDESSQV